MHVAVCSTFCCKNGWVFLGVICWSDLYYFSLLMQRFLGYRNIHSIIMHQIFANTKDDLSNNYLIHIYQCVQVVVSIYEHLCFCVFYKQLKITYFLCTFLVLIHCTVWGLLRLKANRLATWLYSCIHTYSSKKLWQ